MVTATAVATLKIIAIAYFVFKFKLYFRPTARREPANPDSDVGTSEISNNQEQEAIALPRN